MDDLRVAAVVMRSEFGDTRANLKKTENFARAAAEQGADVVCFPELNISGYALKEEVREIAEPLPGPSAREVQRIAGAYGIIILAGIAERLVDGGVAITQIVVSPEREPEVYRKLHLSVGEQAFFRAGNEAPVFRTEKAVFGVQLCYDAHFPELSTAMALRGAEVIFVPHASPPPETADEKRARWLRYLSARAYDNSIFLVACNQTGEGVAGINFSGVALILDPRGEVIAESSDNEEQMLIAELKAGVLERTRSTRMGFFLTQRRPDMYGAVVEPMDNTVLGRE
jgi:N-carbamoylputrescine amidase